MSFEREDLLTPQAALFLGLALHELATNAVNHGALGTSEGGIELAWRVEDGVCFWFRWRERGGPAVRSPRQRGFGSRILEQAVSYELQGQTSLEFAPDGVRYEITVPLRELVERTCLR